MALVKCPECKNQVSNKAKQCPHCGAPPKRTGGLLRAFGMVIIAFFGVTLVVAIVGPTVEPPPPAYSSGPAAKAGTQTDKARQQTVPSTEAVVAAVSGSDDFELHRDAFVEAAQTLIVSGRCSVAQFEEMGGWVRSTKHKSRRVYFTYCGKSHVSNRIYVDVSTGEIFQ